MRQCPFAESAIVIAPFVAYSDSSSTIIMVVRQLRIRTTTIHSLPDVMKLRAALPMPLISGDIQFTLEASA